MYHCVVRDIVTGEVLGDHMADTMRKELVVNAILAMLARHESADGCIFHSDRDSQYTSKAVMGLGCVRASRTLECPGNAWSESFFCNHEERADTLDALRDERISSGGSV